MKAVGDLLIGEAFRNQEKYFTLARCNPSILELVYRIGLPLNRHGAACQTRTEPFLLALGKPADGSDNVLRHIAFAKVSGKPVLQKVPDESLPSYAL
jgi:hypothetical protein